MDSVADVGPVEARNDHALGWNAKLNKNIFPRMRIRRRGKRQARNTREFVQQGPEHAIVGTEIMAPFADAMRLIDGEHGDRSEEHTSELQSLMRISYAVFCLKKKNTLPIHHSKDV